MNAASTTAKMTSTNIEEVTGSTNTASIKREGTISNKASITATTATNTALNASSTASNNNNTTDSNTTASTIMP